MFKVFNKGVNNETLDSTARENESLEILDYGKGNAFPAKLIDNIEFSHTIKRCIDVYYNFIAGDGFVDESLNNIIINSDGETLGQLHSKLSKDMAYFEGIYSNVKYNMNFQSSEYFHLPFENSRLGMYNDIGKITNIKYNNQWGQTSGVAETEGTLTFGVYNPLEEIIKAQIALQGATYKGQVLYSHIERPQKRFYPAPQYYSAEHWIKVESKIGNFHVNNVENNFLLSVLMKIVGDPTEMVTKPKKHTDDQGNVRYKNEPTGKQKGQQFKEEMANAFSGSENGGQVMALWAKAKDQFPELEAFPTNTNHDLFIALQKLTQDNLIVASGVPRILANIETAGKLGDANAITESVTYMQGNVRQHQRLLEDHYQKMFMNAANPDLRSKSFKIKPFSYDLAENIENQILGDDPIN